MKAIFERECQFVLYSRCGMLLCNSRKSLGIESDDVCQGKDVFTREPWLLGSHLRS